MPRRKSYVLQEETGEGLIKTFTERVMPVAPTTLPIERLIQHDRLLIETFIEDISLLGDITFEVFQGRTGTQLMDDIRNKAPEIQPLLLGYIHEHRAFANSLNVGLGKLYHHDHRLLYHTINECVRSLKRPYDFSVMSRLLSMILGKHYILNRLPTTLPQNYTQWR